MIKPSNVTRVGKAMHQPWALFQKRHRPTPNMYMVQGSERGTRVSSQGDKRHGWYCLSGAKAALAAPDAALATPAIAQEGKPSLLFTSISVPPPPLYHCASSSPTPSLGTQWAHHTTGRTVPILSPSFSSNPIKTNCSRLERIWFCWIISVYILHNY